MRIHEVGMIPRWIAGRTLAQCIEDGADNLLLLRLGAALLVIFGHGFAVTNALVPLRDPIHWAFPMTASQLLGVMVFFVTSGFLIVLSFERRPELVRFLIARALRLWPALIVCIFAWAFVLGPILSELPVREYFATGQPFVYFVRNISLYFDIQPSLPGVFTHNPGSAIVNVSIWTLPYEASAYLCVAALGVIGVLRRPLLASLLIAVAIGWFVLLPWYVPDGPKGIPYFGRVLLALFGIGALACLWRRHVRISTAVMLLFAVLALATRTRSSAAPLLWLSIAYFVFWFAYVPRLPRIPRDWDLSYGTYLWGNPIQQCLAQFGVRDPFVMFALTVPLVLPTAIGSWLAIERPMLRWKSMFRLSHTTPVDDPIAKSIPAEQGAQ
jgi:peptidoglycan/LPS O-acetylase OafA/YrhL